MRVFHNETLFGTIGQYIYKASITERDALLLCDGRAVSRTTYAALFDDIGTAFGAGDGTTTFNLPDMRGRVPGGAGQGTSLTDRSIGSVVGEESHTLATNEMPSHSHVMERWSRDIQVGLGSSYGLLDYASGTSRNKNTNNTGSGAAHNNMQPTVFAGYWFIYSGI